MNSFKLYLIAGGLFTLLQVPGRAQVRQDAEGVRTRGTATAKCPSHTITFGGEVYRYHQGAFFRLSGLIWSEVAPPPGLQIPSLPASHTSIWVETVPNFYFRGVFYQRVHNGEFKVVPPPVGATIPELPAAARLVLTQGQRVLELNGTYYLETQEANGIPWYTVIGEKDKVDLGTAPPF